MASVANLSLRAIHFIYAFVICVYSCWKRLTWTTPLPLTAARRRIPKHLALLFVTGSGGVQEDTEDTIIRSVLDAVAWCRVTGIKKLTVYEEHGTLVKCTQNIRDFFANDQLDEESSESEMEYPLTPPPSDHSGSRPISPEHGLSHDLNTTTIHIAERQAFPGIGIQVEGSKQLHHYVRCSSKTLTLCIASRRSAKPAIAAVARSLTSAYNRKHRKGTRSAQKHAYVLSVEALDLSLESDDSLSSPDFMILHPIHPPNYNGTPSELHGFPPWHIRLSEIYHNRFLNSLPILRWVTPPPEPAPLDELSFRRALDEFATAEMRFGK